MYVLNQFGSKSAPLNTSAWPNPETGLGYSGGGFEGTPIGSPTAPASDSITIDNSAFGGAAGPYELQFNFDSDPLFSDGLDSSSAGFFDSEFGPFGVDNIRINGAVIGDFESGSDGWDFRVDASIGQLMQVADLADLDPIADPCECPLSDSGNQYVLICSDISAATVTHPRRQRETMMSPPAFVVNNDNQIGVHWSAWTDNPFDSGVGYRTGLMYYPWTCPQTGTVGWTIEPAGPSEFVFTDPATCDKFIEDLSAYYTAGADSLKMTIELMSDCAGFGVEDCLPIDQINQTPYFDDIQLWTVGVANAPAIRIDEVYADVFPQENTLHPDATVDPKSWVDKSSIDGDPTNATMGDAAIVTSNVVPGTRVFFNFRVYPGPQTDRGDPFFSRYGGDFVAPGGGWAKVRMDSTEGAGGEPVPGSFATYVHETAGGVEGSAEYKILPDGVLTPGATVEYFFSADYGVGLPETVEPDTSGGFFLEWDALPGYFESGAEVLVPCTVYIDAADEDAQYPIEEFGLKPALGTFVDNYGVLHPAWDRIDHTGAQTTSAAPVARESFGNNGMTRYQSLIYQNMLFSTGSHAGEGLREADASLITYWLTTTDLQRGEVTKGLWLSGNDIVDILSKSGRPSSNLLLSAFAGGRLVCDTYRDPGCGGGADGDSTFCVRLDPSTGAAWGTTTTYAAVSGNGCPDLEAFNVVDPIGMGTGDLEYVDQDDGGQPVTRYASVSHNQIECTDNYAVVLDAFSLHLLRSVPEGYSGSTRESCGDDSTAITVRASDVFDLFGATSVCDSDQLIVDGGDPSTAPAATTALFQNVPNPFNPQTTIRYDLAEEVRVSISVFNVHGERVAVLVDEVGEPGSYSVTWDGRGQGEREIASGVYWVRMSTSAGYTAATKMVVLK